MSPLTTTLSGTDSMAGVHASLHNAEDAAINALQAIVPPTLTSGQLLVGSGTATLIQDAGLAWDNTTKTLTATKIVGTLQTASLASPTFSGPITLSTAVSQIVPGSTSLSIRNNANTADNILISDAGLVTLRNSLAAVQVAGGTVTSGSGATISSGDLTLADPGASVYTRASIAYDSGGNLLASGQVRQELGPGANLLSATASDAVMGVSLWTWTTGGGADATLSSDSTQFVTGTSSSKLIKTTGAPDDIQFVFPTSAPPNFIRISPGQNYTFSCYARSDAAAGRQWQITWGWLDEVGSQIGATIAGTLSNVSSTWTRLQVSAVAPVGAACIGQINLILKSVLTGESLWIDGVQLEVGPTATPWKLGRSGPYAVNVEEGTTNLLSLSQSTVSDLTGLTSDPAATLTRDTTQSNTWVQGGASAKLTNAAGGYTAIYPNTRTSIVPGTTYTFSCWYATDAPGSMQAVMYFTKADGTTDSTVAAVAGPNWTASALLRRLTFIFTAAADAFFVNPRLVWNGIPAGKSIWMSAPQLEAKDHATTWQPGGTPRADARLNLPLSSFPGWQQGTVSCWVYIDPLFASQQVKRSGVAPEIWQFSTPGYALYLYVDSTGTLILAQLPGIGASYNLSAVTPGWHHLGGTWSIGVFRLYLDGTLVSTSIFQSINTVAITTAYLGTSGGGLVNANTPIAGFQTFRRALTDAEVAVLATSTGPASHPDLTYTYDPSVVSGKVVFKNPVARIISGSTSLSIRDDTNTYDNLLITDSGVVTARAGLTLTGGPFQFGLDTILLRDAANTLAMRNGTTAQTLVLYETYVDGSNFSRLRMRGVSSADFQIFPEGLGTGTLRGLSLGTAAGRLGLYGSTAVVKQAVTGSRGSNAALASLLTALAAVGILTDSSVV